VKVPDQPPANFTTNSEHYKSYDGALWRIYRTASKYKPAWDTMRTFGPVKGNRFDPHPLPAADYPESGVLYVATDATTAFAEVYQDSRRIDRLEETPALVGWFPTRPLQLLDLTGNVPVLNKASASIQMGPKRSTQNWARAIDDRLDVDGLWHLSAITGKPIVSLFARARRVPSFPARPSYRVLLSDDAANSPINKARKDLEYGVVRSRR
jgi:hypothetical protein